MGQAHNGGQVRGPEVNSDCGFFPEREVLRARRLSATPPEPVDHSAARKLRTEMWALWFAVFLPMFVNAIGFGGSGHHTSRSIAVLMYTLWLILAACCACVAFVVWKNVRRAFSPGS
jgi:hypothetical protein